MKYQEYCAIIREQLDRQFAEEAANIEQAAEYCAASVRSGRVIHVFGCGHSQMFAMEVFYRAGGLVPVNALLMFVFYMLVVIMAGPDAVAAYSGGTNYLIYGLLKALGFTAGVLVLLQGVRMLLGELVPAFKGIADKLVPNAVPALDVPALFGFAPNSLMLGFIFATLSMIVAMFLSSMLFGGVPLVSIIGAFFTGGVAGIMGNALGGRIGAMVSGFVYGLELILFSGFTYMLFDRFAAVGAEGTGHDCIDAMALMTIMKTPAVGIIIIALAFVLLSVLEVRYRRKMADKSDAR